MSQNSRRATEAASPPFRWQQLFSAASLHRKQSESADPRDRGIAARADAGFLAYIIKYALPILIPVLGLVGLIFFRD
jgi:hypothetical protein